MSKITNVQLHTGILVKGTVTTGVDAKKNGVELTESQNGVDITWDEEIKGQWYHMKKKVYTGNIYNTTYEPEPFNKAPKK